MSKKQYTHYKSKGGNGGKGWKAAAICLALILTAGSALAVFEWATPYKPSNGFKPSGQEKPLPDDPNKPDDPTTGDDPAGNIKDGNFLVDSDENEGVSEVELLSARILPEDYAANGISEEAESAVVITISEIKPTYVIDRTATWSVDFVGQDTEWSTGKSLSDYIQYTVSEDTLSVTIECLQAFGDPIKFTAVMNSNKNVSVSCTCNYLAQITNVKLKTTKSEISGGTLGEVEYLELTNEARYRYSFGFTYEETVGTVHAGVESQRTENGGFTLRLGWGSAEGWGDNMHLRPSGYYTKIEISGYIMSNISGFGRLIAGTDKTNEEKTAEVLKSIQTMNRNAPPGYDKRVFRVTEDYKITYGGETIKTGTAQVELGANIDGLKVEDADISDSEILFPLS